jgi:hypothetical protein
VFIRFAVNAGAAVKELAVGSRAVGLVMTEFCVLHFLLIVFLFVFLLSSLSLGMASLDRRRLGLSPAPFSSVFLADLAGLLGNPLHWVTLPFTAAALVPLAFLARPVIGAAVLLLALAAAGLSAWALAAVLASAARARPFTALMRVAFAGVMVCLIVANVDFRWDPGTVTLLVSNQAVLLDDGMGRGLLPALRPWMPSAWVMGASSGRMPALPLCFAGAAAAAALGLAALASARTLRAALRPSRDRSRRTREGPYRATGVQGVLIAHELATLAFTPGAILTMLAGIGSALWLLVTPSPTAAIPIAGAVVALSAGFPSASNLFGRDGYALRRLVLVSPDWARVFAARNLAWLCVAGAALLPVSAAGWARLSPPAGLALALTSAVAALALLVWGNLSSILAPSVVHPFSAHAPRREPAFVNQLFPLAIWGLPLLAHRSVGPFGSAAYAAALVGCAVILLALWVLEVRRIRRFFDEDAERVLERL